MARCRITVLTLGFTFNFFLLFTFMKHLQTYIRPDTSLLPVRRWKKIRPKGSIYRRYLGRFFFFFFPFKCKVITKGFTRPAESVILSPPKAVSWQSPTQLPSNASCATWDEEQRYKKKLHTQFTDVTSGWAFYINFERWQPHSPSFLFLIFYLQSPKMTAPTLLYDSQKALRQS